MALRTKVVDIFKKAVQSGNFNRVLNNVEIVDVSKGKLKAEIIVTPECVNISDTLHGGYTATLFDHLSTLALKSYYFADDKQAPTSVSVELNLSYISAVRAGQTVVLETEAIKVGNKLAFLKGEIYNKSNSNNLVATGKHTKYLLNIPSK